MGRAREGARGGQHQALGKPAGETEVGTANPTYPAGESEGYRPARARAAPENPGE